MQNKQTFPQRVKELDPMPEVGDHYLRAEILLPREDKMARGHVVAQSHDANGNLIGRDQKSPILDIRIYQVEIAGGKVTELTANNIVELMYTQCDADGKEY